ncbi:MAG: MerR family transcriptional regulator [Chloroflexia bacterium]
MRIGELAERSEVTVRTIRYYIEEGLLPQPPRRGKYGDFDASYLQRLRLIRRLKEERLSLPAIRSRLAEMGLVSAPLSIGPTTGEVPRGEGLFRSRFAEEAGLTAEQVARLEEMGLLESSEGLLPPEALPLARAAVRLLEWGLSLEELAEIVRQVRREAEMHRRVLDQAGPLSPVSRALQWQEQVGAVSTIRQMLLRRWSYPAPEETP